jgi:hypothetical protein
MARTHKRGLLHICDTITGGYAAWSLRKVSSAYSGNCLKVRRASDNTTQDIGFVNGWCDFASIASFCGASAGYVDTWYDQIGSNNITQATQGRQPQIYTGSAFYTGKANEPVIFFAGGAGTNKYLVTGTGFAPETSGRRFTTLVVASQETTGGSVNIRIWLSDYSGSAGTFQNCIGTVSSSFGHYDTAWRYWNGILPAASVIHGWLFRRTANSTATGRQSQTQTNATASMGTSTRSTGKVHAVGSTADGAAGGNDSYCGEVIHWRSALTDQQSLDLLNNIRTFWGIR